MEPFDRVCGVQFLAVLLGESHVGEDVVLGFVHENCQLGHLGPELVGDLTPLGLRAVGVLLGEGGGDEGGDDAPALAAGMGQQVAGEVHAASLPAASQQIAEIPGVGVLSATAVVAAMGDPAAFRSGREFAAWLGLVPRHSGTGGRVRMLGISKRGDRYLRTLLIHGARAVLTRSKAPPEWALRLAERRPANVVTVAIANKTARTIWALLAHDRAYQANFVNQPA